MIDPVVLPPTGGGGGAKKSNTLLWIGALALLVALSQRR